MEVEFEDESDAVFWIVKNQLGRRNLSKFQRCEMVLPMEEKIKEQNEEKRRALISEYQKRGETAPKSAESVDTRDVLAKMAGVGHTMLDMVRTIIELADEPTMEKLRHDELKINSVYKALKPIPQKDKPETRQRRARNQENTDEPTMEKLCHDELKTNSVYKSSNPVPQKGKAEPIQRKSSNPEIEFEGPAIQVDGPIIFNNNPELDEKKEYFSPADFGEVEAQVEICIQDFMMNFRETMKWIGQHHVSGKNESAVKVLLKEGYEAAVDTLHDRFVELKEANK
jgi:hypothetical protein